MQFVHPNEDMDGNGNAIFDLSRDTHSRVTYRAAVTYDCKQLYNGASPPHTRTPPKWVYVGARATAEYERPTQD